MIITTSRVTRNSQNAATLRTACNTAIQEGRSIEITEEYVHGDWWTTYKIEWPDNRELIDCSTMPVDAGLMARI